MLKFCIPLGILFFFSSRICAQSLQSIFQPNLLIGMAGVADEPSLDSIMINPALLGHLPNSGVQLAWGFHSQEYQQRYPGFPAHSSNETGLEAFPTPSFAYKFNRKFGVTAFAIPFPVSVNINKKGLPLIVIGSQNNIDLVAKGQSQGLFTGGLGYSFSPSFSIGAAINYLGFTGKFSALESTSRGELLSGSIASQNFRGGIGISAQLSKNMILGIFTQVMNYSSTNLNMGESPLTATNPSQTTTQPQATGNIGGKNKATSFANPIRIGISVKTTPKIRLIGDVEYERKTESRAFSINDLTEKPRDTYDTISVFSGAEVELPQQQKIYLGYRNQPSSLGQGSPGTTGKAGFGFMTLLDNLGGAPSRPMWAISAGYRRDFGQKIKKSRDSMLKMYAEVGFIYEEVSVGIDNNGEQPGAYLVRNLRLPFKFGYRF